MSKLIKIFLDTANVEVIREIAGIYPIDGVTTNPSVLAKECDNVGDTLMSISKIIGEDRFLHVQTTAATAQEMFAQAKKMKAVFGANFYVKIPITEQGLKAITLCKNADINVTATAVFTPMQALLAAQSGADYVAPYINRIDNIVSDGVDVVAHISKLFSVQDVKTRILAASFKNVQQVYGTVANGAHAVTISGELCKELLFHPYTEKSLDDFRSDWEKKFGKREITDFI
ncbi:MAG: hypothetical protein FWC03_10255 [Treponema sp.]|nr:hypothetical protein [Treponema sp.]